MVVGAGLLGRFLSGDRGGHMEEQALLQACPTTTIASGDFRLSEILVGQRETACVRWNDALNGFTASSGTVRVDGAALPLVIYRRRKADAPARSIFVKVVGGPGESIAPDEGDQRYLNLLGPTDLLVSIGYTGTRYRTLFPNPDFQAACHDMGGYLAELRRRNPSTQLIVIGESLGGQIVAGALQRLDPVDAVILLNPMAFSPDQARNNFSSILKHTSSGDTKISVRRLSSRASAWETGAWTSEPTIDLFNAFFERREHARNLESRLRELGGRQVLVLYGERDDVIGRDLLAGVAQVPGLTVVAIPGLRHRVEAAYADRITGAIRRYLTTLPSPAHS